MDAFEHAYVCICICRCVCVCVCGTIFVTPKRICRIRVIRYQSELTQADGQQALVQELELHLLLRRVPRDPDQTSYQGVHSVQHDGLVPAFGGSDDDWVQAAKGRPTVVSLIYNQDNY